MDQSTFNHGKSGDANPKGRSRSPRLELSTRSLRNEREEKIGPRTSAACGGRLRLCYTLDEGKESERETTNCPPKRVRSSCRNQGCPFFLGSARGESGDCAGGNRYIGGMTSVLALLWNMGTCRSMSRESGEWVIPRVRIPRRSTGAEWLAVVMKRLQRAWSEG